MCGLKVEKKWGVSATDILQTDYGDIASGGLPVLSGLDIAGTPVGSDEYVKSCLNLIVIDKVKGCFDAVDQSSQAPHRHLLNANCGENVRVQHLWQSINPILCKDAMIPTDSLTTDAVHRTLGVHGPMPQWVEQQIFSLYGLVA